MINFWGCSDDCIELDGDVEEEVYGEESELYLSNGFRAKIRYDGEWRIQVLDGAANVPWSLYEAGSDEAIKHTGRDYTDLLIVHAKVEWAVLGKFVRNK